MKAMAAIARGLIGNFREGQRTFHSANVRKVHTL